MKRIFMAWWTTGLLLMALAACVSQPVPTPVQRPVKPGTGSAARPGWQAEWERITTEAKKEGSLMLYTSAGAAMRDPLTRFFKQEYGVNLEWIAARANELSQKIFTEQRAGIYNIDVYVAGVSAIGLAEGNALQSLDPVLFLPEVLDRKAWWGGELIFLDTQHSWVAFLAFPQPPILVNSTMVKPGEVRGWQDLLDPRWKGKIVLYNPRDGAGLAWAYHVSEVIMSRDYLRQFARQEPIVLADSRQQVEWVARGKNPVAVAARTENMVEFMDAGAPVQPVSPIEGVHLTAGAGGVALFRNPPHPNAARLFVNWALTKEGGTLLSKAIGGQSARLDVPTDFLDSRFVRQEGPQKYFNTITAEDTRKKEAFARVAMEIFAPLMK